MCEGRNRFPSPFLPKTMVYTWQAMEPLMELTNEVAQRDDRWLFIASLVVLGCFAVATMRYFVRQHERLIEENNEARTDYPKKRKRMTRRKQRHRRMNDLRICRTTSPRVEQQTLVFRLNSFALCFLSVLLFKLISCFRITRSACAASWPNIVRGTPSSSSVWITTSPGAPSTRSAEVDGCPANVPIRRSAFRAS